MTITVSQVDSNGEVSCGCDQCPSANVTSIDVVFSGVEICYGTVKPAIPEMNGSYTLTRPSYGMYSAEIAIDSGGNVWTAYAYCDAGFGAWIVFVSSCYFDEFYDRDEPIDPYWFYSNWNSTINTSGQRLMLENGINCGRGANGLDVGSGGTVTISYTGDGN